MKRLDFLTRAALRQLLSKIEKEQRRNPSPDSLHTFLNVLNSGLMLDLGAAKRATLREIASYLRRQLR